MKDKNVIPLIYVCRDCLPSDMCSQCAWLAKLLRQDTTLDKISDIRLEVEE